MTAAGKINASNVTAGDRIIVTAPMVEGGAITEARTKTGDVMIVRVTGKRFQAAQGRYEARGKYVIETTAGEFEAAPIQTMWLAPEDAAGVKRAHAEATAENGTRAAATAQAEMDEATANQATPQYRHFAEVTRTAGGYAEALDALHAEALAEESIATDLATAQRELAEALDRWLPAEATPPLGATLRPIMEAGVRQARDIPEGRRRHGQIKARRDALRHARKLELAGI